MVDKEKIRDMVYGLADEQIASVLVLSQDPPDTAFSVFKERITKIFNTLIDTTIDITLEEHNHLLHQRGRHKKEFSNATLKALRNSNPPLSYAKIAKELNCSTGTVINRLKELGIYKPIFKQATET